LTQTGLIDKCLAAAHRFQPLQALSEVIPMDSL
jgi:hypothetical protein